MFGVFKGNGLACTWNNNQILDPAKEYPFGGFGFSDSFPKNPRKKQLKFLRDIHLEGESWTNINPFPVPASEGFIPWLTGTLWVTFPEGQQLSSFLPSLSACVLVYLLFRVGKLCCPSTLSMLLNKWEKEGGGGGGGLAVTDRILERLALGPIISNVKTVEIKVAINTSIS